MKNKNITGLNWLHVHEAFAKGIISEGSWKTILFLLSSVLPVTNLFGKVLKFATNIEGELDEWEGGRGGEPVYTVSNNCL